MAHCLQRACPGPRSVRGPPMEVRIDLNHVHFFATVRRSHHAQSPTRLPPVLVNRRHRRLDAATVRTIVPAWDWRLASESLMERCWSFVGDDQLGYCVCRRRPLHANSRMAVAMTATRITNSGTSMSIISPRYVREGRAEVIARPNVAHRITGGPLSSRRPHRSRTPSGQSRSRPVREPAGG